MSHGNGYDARGEDEAIRRELGQAVEHQGRVDSRVLEAIGKVNTTMDRLATGLGRLSEVERLVKAIAEKLGVT